MSDYSVTIRGLQELNDLNVRTIAALKPTGAMGRAVKYAVTEGHRFLVSIVHVDTGAYRASNRMEVTADRGQIYVDPGARNPRSKQLVADYAPEEEARGGEHAAYARTVAEINSRVLDRAVQYLQAELPL
ncbi:MAG: hypothetical protein BroJett011_62780 [Chloroflexota bacterium]|nr:MAG: hypothetical protein BroJett011_62780 [Chloroflexota bacterium]